MTMRNKVLFIELNLDPTAGGVERVTQALSEYFNAHGIETFFAFQAYNVNLIDNRHKIQVDFYNTEREILYDSLSSFIDDNKITTILVQDIASEQIRYCFKRLRKERGVEVIYCFHRNPISSRLSSPSRWIRMKVRIYNFVHGVERKYDFADVYEDVDKYVLLSQSYIKPFKQLYHLPDTDKFIAMPNPVPFTLAEPDFVKKENIVLIIARFEEQVKNIKGAIDIWADYEMVSEDHSWQLVIGGYGEDYEQVLAYAKRLKLSRCAFIGKVENPVSLYQRASIYMMTSRYEGYPMTILEAMQNGCVPIAYDTFTPIHDMIDDRRSGVIIPPYREKDYVNALLTLTEDKERRIKMATNAYHKVKQENSIETIGQQWIQLFNNDF